MSFFPEPDIHIRTKIQVELDLRSYFLEPDIHIRTKIQVEFDL